MTEFFAHQYDDRLRAGKELPEDFEDEEFDVEDEYARIAAEAEAAGDAGIDVSDAETVIDERYD